MGKRERNERKIEKGGKRRIRKRGEKREKAKVGTNVEKKMK